jgi:cytochrome b561
LRSRGAAKRVWLRGIYAEFVYSLSRQTHTEEVAMRYPRQIAVDAVRYDRATIWLHWATVALVVLLWLIGQTADWAPWPLRAGVWSTHVTLGAIATLVLAALLTWRLRFGRVLPPAGGGVLQTIAKATHIALYLLLVAVLALGVANALYLGFNVFGVLPLPLVGSGDVETGQNINEWHGLVANLLVLVALVHMLAAFVHQYMWRDRLIERMIP